MKELKEAFKLFIRALVKLIIVLLKLLLSLITMLCSSVVNKIAKYPAAMLFIWSMTLVISCFIIKGKEVVSDTVYGKQIYALESKVDSLNNDLVFYKELSQTYKKETIKLKSVKPKLQVKYRKPIIKKDSI